MYLILDDLCVFDVDDVWKKKLVVIVLVYVG